MTGAVVNWLLGAAPATVASVAGRRLLRWRRARTEDHAVQRLDSAVHLVMALGMAAMLAPADAIPMPALLPALGWGFGALALVLLTSRGGHRLHHVAMASIMALMAESPHHGASVMAPGMLMPPEPSPWLLAAFGYTCVSALVIAWRLPAPAHHGTHGAADPLGRACEIVMFVSMAVMLLPMI